MRAFIKTCLLAALAVGLCAGARAAGDEVFVVSFDFDSAELLPQDGPVIEAVLAAAAAQPGLTLRIVAHTDTVGSEVYNQALAERRANTVILALLQGGLNRGRIITEPVGEGRLRVETADNVPEPDNRVAVIDLL